MVTFVLVVVGALNWGLVGLLDFNLVTTLLGAWPSAVTLTYVLIGLSAVNELVMHKELCKLCGKK